MVPLAPWLVHPFCRLPHCGPAPWALVCIRSTLSGPLVLQGSQAWTSVGSASYLPPAGDGSSERKPRKKVGAQEGGSVSTVPLYARPWALELPGGLGLPAGSSRNQGKTELQEVHMLRGHRLRQSDGWEGLRAAATTLASSTPAHIFLNLSFEV